MKITTIHLLFLGLLPLASLPAASYNKAEITRLEKDVKVLKENAAPHTAEMGEQINPVTSVATGVASRVELRFPDKSLTRLGANSRFTLHGEGRTVDLDKGVMLMEVPQKIIGAKVRTAAVTAAVTGGTAMIEYLPNGFIKIFCLDGHLDVVNNADPSDFLTINAGQFILMPAKAKKIPRPAAEFDINLMLRTSKLVSPDEDTPTNKDIADAVKDQAKDLLKGDLIKTHLIMPGRGTLVSISNNTALNLFNNFTLQDNSPTAPKPNGAPGPPTPPAFTGYIPLIADTTILNGNSRIKTDPQVTAYNTGAGKIITSEGLIYNGLKEKPFPFFAFGNLNISDPNLQPWLNSKGDWAAYKFDTLIINGTPEFVYDNNIRLLSINSNFVQPPQIGNVLLSALNNISLDANNPLAQSIGGVAASTSSSLDIGETIVTNLLLYSQNGSVELAENFSIYSSGQDVSIVAAGSTSDVTLRGDVNIDNANLLIGAGRDVLINSNISANDVAINAGRDVTVDGFINSDARGGIIAKYGNLSISAKRNIHITNSAQLEALATADGEGLLEDALLSLNSTQGDITVEKGSKISGTNVEIAALNGNVSILNSNITATHALKVGAFRPDGTLLINGSVLTTNGSPISPSDLIRLYAGGSNGKVLFQGKVTLDSDEVQIAGKTVQVDTGGNVDVTKGNAHVFSDNHNYNKTGYGNINSTSLKQHDFNSRPDFKTGVKLGVGP
ncbi:MAG: FecR domain-containing protein [Verrucomicrobiaceae bacterium]